MFQNRALQSTIKVTAAHNESHNSDENLDQSDPRKTVYIALNYYIFKMAAQLSSKRQLAILWATVIALLATTVHAAPVINQRVERSMQGQSWIAESTDSSTTLINSLRSIISDTAERLHTTLNVSKSEIYNSSATDSDIDNSYNKALNTALNATCLLRRSYYSLKTYAGIANPTTTIRLILEKNVEDSCNWLNDKRIDLNSFAEPFNCSAVDSAKWTEMCAQLKVVGYSRQSIKSIDTFRSYLRTQQA